MLRACPIVFWPCATAYNTAHAKTSAQEKPSATASEGPWRVTLEAAIFILLWKTVKIEF